MEFEQLSQDLREIYGTRRLLLEACERHLQSITMEGAVGKKLTLKLVDFPEQSMLTEKGYQGKENDSCPLQVEHSRESMWVWESKAFVLTCGMVGRRRSSKTSTSWRCVH